MEDWGKKQESYLTDSHDSGIRLWERQPKIKKIKRQEASGCGEGPLRGIVFKSLGEPSVHQPTAQSQTVRIFYCQNVAHGSKFSGRCRWAVGPTWALAVSSSSGLVPNSNKIGPCYTTWYGHPIFTMSELFFNPEIVSGVSGCGGIGSLY